jgi:DNA-directed RNA polymerase sigma subunit (sigma70/sigma32)
LLDPLQVAQQIGLSHQRVSQLQSKAQQKLERACEVGGSELRAGLEELCTALED